MESLFHRTPNIPNSRTFTLTQLGKKEAEDFGGDTVTRVLVSIEELGACNIQQICGQSGMSRNKVEGALSRALKQGKVHSIKGEGE